MGIWSGTVHATPSLDTFELLIALATSRVFCRLPPGSVQAGATAAFVAAPGCAALPAPPAPTGVWALAAAASSRAQADAPEPPLLLLPQPPTAKPAATTRDSPATVGRQRTPIALLS